MESEMVDTYNSAVYASVSYLSMVGSRMASERESGESTTGVGCRIISDFHGRHTHAAALQSYEAAEHTIGVFYMAKRWNNSTIRESNIEHMQMVS
jgi:hypothetical protein